MTKGDLEKAIIGIVISHMERYHGPSLTIIHSEQLYKELKADMFSMYASWWKPHFPNFHFKITIKSLLTSEPMVDVDWTHDGQVSSNWCKLLFTFNPAQLVGGHDPIAAYDRAMKII